MQQSLGFRADSSISGPGEWLGHQGAGHITASDPSVEESTALCQDKLAWRLNPTLMDPHTLALTSGGQATQDRTTFPVGKWPRRNPPFSLIQLGYESGKVPLALFLSPPPHPNGPVAQEESRAIWSCPTSLLPVRSLRSTKPPGQSSASN